MRHRPRRGLIIAAVIAGSLPLTAGNSVAAELDPAQLRTVTDENLFAKQLPEFAAAREAAPHADQLDWTSDGCSMAPDRPLGHDFTTSCQRHDFGYRNYEAQQRFNAENRARIDENFRSDMASNCDARLTCHATAHVYYWAVREFGDTAASTSEAVDRAQIRPIVDDAGILRELHADNRAGHTVEFTVPEH